MSGDPEAYLVKSRPRAAPHWYRRYIGECPVCGRDQSYRVRIYGPKPPLPGDRYVLLPDTQTYDHCLERQ